MEQFAVNLKAKLDKEKQDINSEGFDILQESMKMLVILEHNLNELKMFLESYKFKNDKEEILFFKEIKPHFFSLLLYYNEVYYVEMRMPISSFTDKVQHLEAALNRIKHFFDMNIEFYQYYRSNSTHLDGCYFLRGKSNVQYYVDSLYLERDTNFSTYYDYMISKILANEMLSTYLNQKIQRFEYCINQSLEFQNTSNVKSRLTWTATKSDLVLQLYAWEGTGCFNYGNITIKELAEYIEFVFNINLGDYYRTFLEIRNKKGNRTSFLNKMIKYLEDRMLEADSR